jgi:hypothetical protein
MKQLAGASNKWYKFSGEFTFTSGTLYLLEGGSFPNTNANILTSGTSTRIFRRSNSDYINLYSRTFPLDVLVDNVSFREIPLVDMLALSATPTADVFVGIDLTVTSSTPAGLALNWDSVASPANGIIVYHDGTNVKFDKCVSGTWTNVSSASATYSANAKLTVAKIGTDYRVYYNNALVMAVTVTDAGIINNVTHGLFSTDSSNQLDNYTCYASGTSGEHVVLGTI